MSDFPQKFKKLVPGPFIDAVETMDDAEMDKSIIDCEKVIVETEKELDDDPKIKGTKELLKDLTMSRKDVLSVQKAKIKYVLHVMKQRGKF